MGAGNCNMKAWTDLILSFAAGFAVGIVFAAFHFRSRLRFYKQFIEHRLASINRLRPSKVSPWSFRKLSIWKDGASRPSKSRKGSKEVENK